MFNDLFAQTASQALQGFLPVAVALAWLRRHDRVLIARAVKWGAAASIAATALASFAFQRAAQQSRVEALLAIAASVLAFVVLRIVWRERPALSSADVSARQSSVWMLAGVAAAATMLVIVRQSMEMAVVLYAAAFEIRAAGPTTSIVTAMLLGLALCIAWIRIERSASPMGARVATRSFSVVFLLQLLMYAVHESSEAHLLPWSETIHAATEAYGPDSAFSVAVSGLLFLLPIGLLALVQIRERLEDTVTTAAIGAFAVVVVCGMWLMGTGIRGTAATEPVAAANTELVGDATALSAEPHLIFRNARRDASFGKLGIAALKAPDGARATVDLPCQRVSFAADGGICLQTIEASTSTGAASTSYRAVLFDGRFGPGKTFDLQGTPSRTRTSPSGRLGTMTVFLSGQQHGYGAASFITKTSLVDMASRTILIDNLEDIPTWRDGKPFAAKDFNFWGVTFTNDDNTFFATLRTDGRAYLVKGDIARRRMTVLHENVECPSLSPDNRRIAYKKRVGPASTAWRLYILDLETMTDHELSPETRYVDDQVEWLDDARVLYAVRRLGSVDVWDAPIDGSGPARVLIHDAESPIVIR